MTNDTAFQLLHRGKHLAVEVATSRAAYMAWVGVYPLDHTRPDTLQLLRRFGIPELPSATIYRVRTFEVLKTLVDEDRSISEDDLSNKRDAIAIGNEQLIERLIEFKTCLGDLDLPYKSNYPI